MCCNLLKLKLIVLFELYIINQFGIMRGSSGNMFSTHGAISPWVICMFRGMGTLLVSDINGKIATSGKSISDIKGQKDIFIANRPSTSNAYGCLEASTINTNMFDNLEHILALV